MRRTSLVGIDEQVVPRARERFFQLDNGINGRTLTTRLDGLEKSAAEIGLFGEAFLREFCGGAKAANILAENKLWGPLHRLNDAGQKRVERDL